MRTLIISFLVSILAGCAATIYPITSSYYRIPGGSRVELNQTLTILPNNARVYIQYGKVVSPIEKDQYHAHCWFLSWKLLDTPQVITPDTFIVTNTEKREDLVQSSVYVKLASQGSIQGSVSSSDNGLIAVEYTTELQIHSDKQPDIKQLLCSHWDDPSMGEHLTIEQMQMTLGEIVQIRVN